MKAVRHWSVRHASLLKKTYGFADVFARALRPALTAIGARRMERILRPIERSAKGFFFDCKMCGQCVLSSTGMSCPTNCAKQMRNGPCGGVRADGGCEVHPTMRCVWVEAVEGQKQISGSPSTAILPPIDRRQLERSTWVRVIEGGLQIEAVPPQPPPAAARPIHAFEKACRAKMSGEGPSVVTVEIAPPDSADPAHLIERAERFRDLVDAINITDGAGGNCHMSSAAATSILAGRGLAPVCQLGCRDRNRIAIQGDLLGVSALGGHNILCLTGDDVSQGDHPKAKPVFDLDSVTLLRLVTNMRDKGEFASGRKITSPPNLFIGATANPFVPPYRDRVANLERKVLAGAQFIQTQFCFDIPMFEEFMSDVRARGLHQRAAIIVGVGTLSSAKALRWMAHNVPGVYVPESLIERIERADDQKEAGLQILVEMMQALVAIEGVAGVHLMGHKNEATLAEAIRRSGLKSAALCTQ
jgi:methylenetetrahydrofolate reductase (NADPH)